MYWRLTENIRKNVRWSAVPVPCLSRFLFEVERVAFTHGEFSPSPPSSNWDSGLKAGFGPQGWDLGPEAWIWALRLGGDGEEGEKNSVSV